MKFLKYLLSAAAVAMMVIIFWLSDQPGYDSTLMSGSVGYSFCDVFIDGFEEMDLTQQAGLVLTVDYPLRKCAHAFEYMVLSVLCTGSLLLWFYHKMNRPDLLFLFGWIISLLYAVSDEIHQFFVPGRSCMLLDIVIDAAGAAAGALLLMLICHRILRRRHSSET